MGGCCRRKLQKAVSPSVRLNGKQLTIIDHGNRTVAIFLRLLNHSRSDTTFRETRKPRPIRPLFYSGLCRSVVDGNMADKFKNKKKTNEKKPSHNLYMDVLEIAAVNGGRYAN